MNDIDEAKKLLHEDAIPEVMEVADELVDAGQAEWIYDPDAERVVGLVRTGTNKAFVVVYLKGSLAAAGGPGDWELSDEMDALVFSR